MTGDDPGDQLFAHPRFEWAEGMRDRRGVRIVDLALWEPHVAPDLSDPGTAGVLLGQLDAAGQLSDIVKQDGEWIVAISIGEALQGYAADTLGEAAAWALLALWDTLDDGDVATA